MRAVINGSTASRRSISARAQCPTSPPVLRHEDDDSAGWPAAVRDHVGIWRESAAEPRSRRLSSDRGGRRATGASRRRSPAEDTRGDGLPTAQVAAIPPARDGIRCWPQGRLRKGRWAGVGPIGTAASLSVGGTTALRIRTKPSERGEGGSWPVDLGRSVHDDLTHQPCETFNES
jgi:hypothetical protein